MEGLEKVSHQVGEFKMNILRINRRRRKSIVFRPTRRFLLPLLIAPASLLPS